MVYYSSMDLLVADIVLTADPNRSLKDLAANLHLSIYSRAMTWHYFPASHLIDRTNAVGYAKAAPEFLDEYRITTRNFHELSRRYFVKAATRYIAKGMKCLEIGVGQGWLGSILSLPGVDCIGIDISAEMIEHSSGKSSIQAIARHMEFPDQHFDIAMASLADPYCFPTA